MFGVLPIGCGVLCLPLFCSALLCVLSRFTIVLKRKRYLVALLLLSYGCLVTVNVLWLFLAVPWVGLRCVIVVFPDHTNCFFKTGNCLRQRNICLQANWLVLILSIEIYNILFLIQRNICLQANWLDLININLLWKTWEVVTKWQWVIGWMAGSMDG